MIKIEGQKVQKEDPNTPGGDGFEVSVSMEGVAVLVTALIALLVRTLRPWVIRVMKSWSEVNTIKSVMIRDSLVSILVLTGAKSVVLVRFHNGELDESGYHLLKMSLVEEVVVPPFKTEWTNDKGKIVEVRGIKEDLSCFLNPVFRDLWLEYDFESPEFSSKCKRFLEPLGHKYQLRRTIYAGNVPAGALAINFKSKEEAVNSVTNSSTMASAEVIFQNLSDIIVGNIKKEERAAISRAVMNYISPGNRG